MPRSLNARRPYPVEVRQLHSAMEKELTARQRRRAEVLVLHAAGLEAAEIARALDVHVNTIYSDLRAFEQHGVASVGHRLRGGPPAQITDTQRAEMVRLAETPPAEMGLPYGRWSLSKLRGYLLKRRVVKAISREHLRRVLRKGGCAFGVSNAS
jgi:transposase